MPKKKRRPGNDFEFTAPLSVEECVSVLEEQFGDMRRDGNMYRFYVKERSSAPYRNIHLYLRWHSTFATNVQIVIPKTGESIAHTMLITFPIIAICFSVVVLRQSLWGILVGGVVILLCWLGIHWADHDLVRSIAHALEAD